MADLLTNDTARIITETIILMAHKLGKVIAEGVESQGDFEQLLLGGPAPRA